MWVVILDALIEPEILSILYKDACNSNYTQKNSGTLSYSNLCAETIEYSSKTMTAVCNIVNPSLPTFVTEDFNFDFMKLHEVAKIVIRSLNNIIAPAKLRLFLERSATSSIALSLLGAQGLADI